MVSNRNLRHTREYEQALAGTLSADNLQGVNATFPELNSDIHASAEYRAHLVNVMARRAVDAANK